MLSNQTTIRILLADDHAVTRAGVRSVLEAAPDMTVVGEAADGDHAQAMAAELRPDVVLLDLIMPGRRAYQVEEWIRTHYPQTVVLILTGHDRDQFLAQAVTQGVQGYLTKEKDAPQLVEAIRRAVCGECLVTDEQIARADQWNQEVGWPWRSLTDRERQVLVLCAQGMENKAIAEHLGISAKAVEFHAKNVYRKLRVKSRCQAIAWLYTHLPEEAQSK
jgi:NarL family two-component system response regulator LiaR